LVVIIGGSIWIFNGIVFSCQMSFFKSFAITSAMIPIAKPEMNSPTIAGLLYYVIAAIISILLHRTTPTNSRGTSNARLLMTTGSACINIFPTSGYFY
jgi:hypothetical protein